MPSRYFGLDSASSAGGLGDWLMRSRRLWDMGVVGLEGGWEWVKVSGLRTKAVDLDLSGCLERKEDSDSLFSSFWKTKDWTEVDSTMEDCFEREALDWVSSAIASSSASSKDLRHSSAGDTAGLLAASEAGTDLSMEVTSLVVHELDSSFSDLCSCC